ncbi:phosphate regulon sensor histidine kinase PhoR [Erythrobacter litoralis]|jgi:two-component system phosphate regulon sensor histidine kinase PhoR|uniref:histidine kinase n=1 Tax=Erythrobacter litoralis TaxID=39960 RepID=A0A074MZK5_9SPHN|nr:ATP-binding protein [Erythrobacter litoralis]AOL23677.1 phosphate regulon sensor histidine kinase PhoR [Erythrobacter litoralis]KEO98839.1 histidine kinase [Erythrobacter litoralis]MEE4338594.1 ATP-binding protein [Erythrobacter sp.]
MGRIETLPVAGITLAAVTFVALLLLGIDPVVALAVLAVWVGSLLVAAIRPPEPPTVRVEKKFTVESMRGLIENSSIPLLVTELGAIALANRAARRMLGQHVVGQDARVIFRQPEAITLLGRNRDGQAIVRGLVRRQDIWQINRQSIDDRLAVIELINQTAEADISRAHTDFVANASHELRTPMAAILGYVETLRESGDSLDSPTAQKFLATIEREARRLQSLISDLMSLSRVEAEKHDPPQDRIELAALVERAAREGAGPDRSERLEFELSAAPVVHGDRQQLEQVVRNLVDNALKYGAADAPVRVMLDLSRENQARLVVIDRGEGIAPEQIPHLTRRFYRTDPGRSRASGGTGLGLAIVKHIVERHRGRLDIDSTLGEGTRVSIRIPLAEPQQPQTAPAAQDQAEPSEAQEMS